MPLTAAAKNVALDAAIRGQAPALSATHVGLFDAGTALTGVTGVTSTDTFTKTAHGLTNGTVVILSALTGGSGLVTARPYFVIGVTANTFQLALTSGGAAVDLGSDVSSVTATPLAELSGGTYARVAIAWNAAAAGAIDDSSNGININVPAGATIDYVGYFSAITAGTLMGLSLVSPPEGPYGSAGIYTVQDADVVMGD